MRTLAKAAGRLLVLPAVVTAAQGLAAPPAPGRVAGDPAGCRTPAGVQSISFSAAKYPRIRAHFLAARKAGWPRTLVLNRPGARAAPRPVAGRRPDPQGL